MYFCIPLIYEVARFLPPPPYLLQVLAFFHCYITLWNTEFLLCLHLRMCLLLSLMRSCMLFQLYVSLRSCSTKLGGRAVWPFLSVFFHLTRSVCFYPRSWWYLFQNNNFVARHWYYFSSGFNWTSKCIVLELSKWKLKTCLHSVAIRAFLLEGLIRGYLTRVEDSLKDLIYF